MTRQNPAGNRALLQLKSRELIVSAPPTQAQYSKARSPVSSSGSEERSLQHLALFASPALYSAHLRIEPVPAILTVGIAPRFSLVHCESGLLVPGQFNQDEAELILETTENWDWSVDPKTRKPACSRYLLTLLEDICAPKPKKVQGVAA